MAELDDTIRSTFAARTFTDDPVPDAVIHELLDVARFASSGGNRQGWRVVVVRDAATRRRLIELGRPSMAVYLTQAAAGERPFNTITPTSIDVAAAEADPPPLDWVDALAEAPVHLVIGLDLSEVASFDAELDRVGVVSGASIYPFAHNILLAARARGYGGTLTTFISRAEDEVRELLGFPPDVAVAALLPLGVPPKLLTRLRRDPVEAFARWERWDGDPVERPDDQ
ncbi:MAG: nitroreductase family protein [Actinomycetota bacterium]